MPSILDEAVRVARMAPPTAPIRMVLDTDTYNEIDDQFALAYALLSPERLAVEAIYAAPFHNERSCGPEDGMEKSHDEILRLLSRLGVTPEGFVFKGSRTWLPAADKPTPSEAAEDLIRRSRQGDGLLYVVAIGAITNVASALLMDPTLGERIVLVWLGGHAIHWPDTNEFNLMQDLHASRVAMDGRVPLVRLPCAGIVDHLHTTLPEIMHHCRGRGAIGDYLADIYADFYPGYARSKVIWDIAAVAWLVNPAWVPTVLRHSPIPEDSLRWSFDDRRPIIREAVEVNRDAILGDLFRKLEKHSNA
jgi:inosine-uridine nucleoside N-ribohydrolase